MANNKTPYINFSKNKIDYGFHARYVKEENGMYSWYIPSFDIYFSSNTKEQGDKRAISMTRAFFSHWINQESFRSFILQIHKLGFKAPENHDFTIKQLLNKKIFDVKLKSKNSVLPEDFKNSELVEQQGNLELAI